MNIVMFGLPACGKGTQAALLKKKFGYESFSTGDMLRELKTQSGPIAESLRALPPGTFASDDLIIAAVKEELTKSQYSQGIIFDGFPRTISQARALEAMGIKIDVVVELSAIEDALIERGVNRRVHVASGRIYNLRSAPPQIEGLDDLTGEPLTWRDDDKEIVMRKRFKDYQEKTSLALQFFKEWSLNPMGPRFISLDAMQSTEMVFSELEKSLKQLPTFASKIIIKKEPGFKP